MNTKSIAERDISRIKSNAVGMKKAANTAYKQSASVVDKAANAAQANAAQMYKASQNRLGNVSNTTKNKLEVGYGNNVSNLRSAKAEAKASLANTKAQNLAKMRQSYNQQKANSRNTYGKKMLAEKVEKRTKNMENYKSTVSRFDTTKKCDAAIKKLKASNDPNKKEKIAYIQAQRAALLQAEKQSKSGGRRYGRGWHRWGSGWRNWSSSSSGDTEMKVTPKGGKETVSSGEMTAAQEENYQKNLENYPTKKAVNRATGRKGNRILPESKRTQPIYKRRNTYKGVGKW